MAHEHDIATIVEEVKSWPEEDRVALAYVILRNLRQETRQAAPRRTLERALGVARGTSPPPDDATVRQWIEEHRTKKYG